MTIEIKELTKCYREKVVVDQLSFSIKQGGFFALLGQNAAGKTSTIKMLCGLLLPTDGDALLDGKSIVENQVAAKKIMNISPQETAVAPNLTVFENLLFLGRIYGLLQNTGKGTGERKYGVICPLTTSERQGQNTIRWI